MRPGYLTGRARLIYRADGDYFEPAPTRTVLREADAGL